MQISHGHEDCSLEARWKWRFSVRSYYDYLKHVPGHLFPWKGVWGVGGSKVPVPRKGRALSVLQF